MSQLPEISLDEDSRKILEARHHNPFGVLGVQAFNENVAIFRTIQPEAELVSFLNKESGEIFSASRIEDSALFATYVPMECLEKPYEIILENIHGIQHIVDPYAYGLLLGEQDMHYFGEGRHWRLYDVLGAHLKEIDGVLGIQFALWAPNAGRVSVVGDFNNWDGRVHPMRCRVERGVWELFIPGVGLNAHYKFELRDQQGHVFTKSDPFAFFSQHGIQTASLTWDYARYQWSDSAWMNQRAKANIYQLPISVYEVHLGSWRKKHDGRFLTYLELAEQLIPYVKEHGFTHLELMPISEFPFDGSWGYQVGGYFAPTSRYGNPDDFREFVDRCHQAGIGVIIDWVPAHFPKDAHGLAKFDGTALYEHADPRQGEHMDWGTLIFNFGRNEVRNFLISNALFWLEQYHIDGIRVDAVASMLYLDYSRSHDQWVPNHFGGRENLAAIEFMRELNTQAYAQHQGVMMIAEESTSWPGVSRPVSTGGLGFGYKWNMGWMNDSLNYISKDPIHRRYHHGQATFSMLYAYDESFMLVLSHDEVVHGKRSILDKMPGDRWQKFANMRMYLSWMWMHPGKKLIFMGTEIAQWKEWNHEKALDWEVLYGEEHRHMQGLVKDLNHLYQKHRALHSWDHDPRGFFWLDANDAEQSLFSFARVGDNGEVLYVIVNATPAPRYGYRLGVAAQGSYREVLNTDAKNYSGSGQNSGDSLYAEPVGWQGQPYSLVLTIPPLATIVLKLHE